MAFILQHSGGNGKSCHADLFYDCTAAAHSADGAWNSSGNLSAIATAVFNMTYAATSFVLT